MKKKRKGAIQPDAPDVAWDGPQIIAMGKIGKPHDLLIFKQEGIKIVEGDPVNKILDQAELTNAEKIRFLFEKDYPYRKAVIDGKLNELFKAWLIRKGLIDDYFRHGGRKG